MLNEILIKIYNRDLEKLKDEINSYHHEKNRSRKKPMDYQ